MENFGKFVTILLGMLLSTLMNGFVFMKLWNWFIVSIFEAKPLILIQSMAIMVLIAFIRIRKSKDGDEDFWKVFIESMIFVILTSSFTLLIGFIVKSLM